MTLKIDQIIRSRRRTIALEITADARLIVRIPRWASPKSAEKVVAEKAAWIAKKLHEMRSRQSAVPVRRFATGEEFLYLGELYKLHIAEGKPFFANGFNLPKTANAREIFEKWYRAEALRVFSQRVARYGFLTNLKPKSLRITNTRRQWGSCNGKNVIALTWRLIMAPLEVIDYVVVHELAHLAERNHSPRFWRKVGEIFPDYKKQRKWLKDNGHLLVL